MSANKGSVLRHLGTLTLLMAFFLSAAALSSGRCTPAWALGWPWEWIAVALYTGAVVSVSFWQAAGPRPRLRSLWGEMTLVATVFSLSASMLRGRIYDNVLDEKMSLTPFIVFGCAATALMVGAFPTSYILWLRFGRK